MKTIKASQIEGPSDRSTFIALMVLTALVLAWRAPELLVKPQFWAEDGAIFFAQQHGQAWPHLFMPYWGYLHFIPRSIAWLSDLFAVKHAPILYGFFSLAIDAACIAYVARRVGLLYSPLVVWLSLTFIPNDGLYTGYIQNIQWFTQFVIVALCLVPGGSSSNRTGGRIAACIALAMCSLTGPFSAIVAILCIAIFIAARIPSVLFPWQAAFRAYWNELYKDRIFVVILCAVVQLVVAASSPTGDQLLLPSGKLLRNAFGQWPQDHFFGVTLLPSGLFILLVAGGLTLLLRSRKISNEQKILSVALLAMAIAELLLGTTKPGAMGPGMMGGDRYYLIGKTGAWWAVTLLAIHYSPKKGHAILATAAAIFAIAALNPQWMRRAPLPDLDWRSQADSISAGQETMLRINPGWWDKRAVIPARVVDKKAQ